MCGSARRWDVLRLLIHTRLPQGTTLTFLHLHLQEQIRVAVGPGNAHFISVRQVSSDAATLRRGRRIRHVAQWLTRARFYADAAVYRQFDD